MTSHIASTTRKDKDISQTDIRLGLGLLDRKQTDVKYDEENKKLIIEIDISHLMKEESD